MNDTILSWQPSAAGNPTSYRVTWKYKGVNLSVQTIARTAAQDAAGYSLDFVAANPAISVQPGDVIGVSMDAFDAVNDLASPAVSAPDVTIPAVPVPPSVPQNVTLVLA